MANKKAAEPLFVAGMGEAPEDTENGANMAEQYREAAENAQRENEEAAEQRRQDEKSRPVVALGTAEAIAMGVRAGESPTEGERPEGWEFVSEDVATTAKLVGKVAEVRAEGREQAEAAEREAQAALAEAEAEAEDEAEA